MSVDRFKLLHGPYVAPVSRAGDTLHDERHGAVKVGGYTTAPIPWPRLLKTGKHSPILCGDLVRAVGVESSQAVAHHWGVSVTTVWAWRQALGVEQMTEGTRQLYREYMGDKLPDDVAAVGRERAARPEALAKMSASKRGKPAHPTTADALRRAASRRKRKPHRQRIGKALQLYWLKSVRMISTHLVRDVLEYRKAAKAPGRGTRWHPIEEALLGLGPDRVVAGILARPVASVRTHRRALNIPRYLPPTGLSPKLDRIVRSVADRESDRNLSDDLARELFPDVFEEGGNGHD